MAGMDWFRWHHGSVTDPKFQLVAHKCGSSVAEVIGVWAMFLEAASMAERRGCHGELDFEAIDFSLGLSDGKTLQIYELMCARRLVNRDEKTITSWVKRQPLREDETANDRKRRQREREHEMQVANAVTLSESRTVTHSHALSRTVTPEEIRLEEIREDSSSTATVLVDVDQNQREKAQGATGAKRRSRIPNEFFPNENGVAKAQSLGLTLDVELTKFRDYHQGKGTLMADWDAAWRTWIGNARQPPKAAHFETAYQRSMREKVAAFAPAIAKKAPGETEKNLIVLDHENVAVNQSH